MGTWAMGTWGFSVVGGMIPKGVPICARLPKHEKLECERCRIYLPVQDLSGR